MPIDISDLEPGDVVFPYTGVDLSVWGTKTGHVMLVGEGDRDQVATQIHQVGTSMTTPKPVAGSQRERLVPNSPKADGESASRKRILRCRKDKLRRNAARLALYWQRWFKMGFAERRRNNGVIFEEHNDIDAGHLVDALRGEFRRTGMFRAVKYAARRDGYLSYPDESGEAGQGMFCSMFVTICYQVAGLLDVVHPADVADRKLRVSDKKMTEKDLSSVSKQMHKQGMACSQQDWNAFARHTLALNDRNHYELKGFESDDPGKKSKKLEYVPSLMYWNFKAAPSIEGFDWVGHITEGMMVDAKIVMPLGLYRSLLDDKAGWRDMGDLVGEQRFENPDHVKERAVRLHDEALWRQKTWLKSGVHK